MSKNEFPVMKGFLDDFTVKGSGYTEETVPNKSGGDEHLGENLDDKAKGKKRKGNLSTGEGTPLNDNLTDLPAAAEGDIKDGYVADIQGKPVSHGKGFNAFNKMVEKGVLVDNIEIKKHGVGETIKEIEGVVEKAFVPGSGAKVLGEAVGRGPVRRTLRKVATAVGDTARGAASAVGGAAESVAEAAKKSKPGELAGRVGQNISEKLRSGTSLGNVGRLDKRVRRTAADIAQRHKELVGAGAVGTPLAAGAYGAKKLSEKD